jgi:hypothetical protein
LQYVGKEAALAPKCLDKEFVDVALSGAPGSTTVPLAC